MSVDYRETLVTYLKSDSLEDAAKNLDVNKAALVQRIARLRKAGVNVPRMKKNMLNDLEVSQLNGIINKWKKGNL